MKREWKKYKNVQFEFTHDCKDHVWYGHIFFAYDLVRNIKPQIIVELGTYFGTSFSSFCKAVKDENLTTDLYAVDNWEGDEHAGFYGDEVLQHVKFLMQKYYPEQNTHLLRTTFDEASTQFNDKTIDILHIDGLHSYEAVKHDFETWSSKVADDGVIILHDILEKRNDFGVFQLWDELKDRFKDRWMFLELLDNFGLGVILKDSTISLTTNQQRDMQRHYNAIAQSGLTSYQFIPLETERNSLRAAVNKLTEQCSTIPELHQSIEKLQRENTELQNSEEELRSRAEDLHNIKQRKVVRIINSLLKLLNRPIY